MPRKKHAPIPPEIQENRVVIAVPFPAAVLKLIKARFK